MSGLVLQKMDDGTYKYCRSLHKQNKELGDYLSLHYETKQCVITPSGMAAIACTLQGVLTHFMGLKTSLYYSNELYCDTPNLIEHTVANHINQAKKIPFDVCNPTILVEYFKESIDTVNILFIESCSNPHGYVFDFSILPQLRKLSKELIVIVDNTWISSASFNPFKYGANVVVSSLTKYYSGGNAIAGAILTDEPYFSDILNFSCCNGMHVSPLNCQIIIDNIQSLHNRLLESSKLTMQIIDRFKDRVEFIHPSVETHPSYNLAKQYFKILPSVCILVITASKSKAIKMMSKNSKIDYQTSFGCKLSKFDPYPIKIGETVHCRLSIGYDDVTLIDGLEEFLNKIAATR
jgi:cystathionine beta-lyase/cystathionine gamma-synthase